jgi:MSHA biogenesis protein MshO
VAIEPITKKLGFTLIEFVITIMLTGIIFSITSVFIAYPIKAYSSIANRSAIVDSAEMSLRRMERDIRNAVPNSIRVKTSGSVTSIEMLNAVEAVRYRADGPGNTSTILDFSAADTDFDILSNFQVATLGSGGNYRLVVYNIGATGTGGSDAPSAGMNVYATSSASGPYPAAGTQVITPAATSVTLSNVGAIGHITLGTAFQFAFPSPQKRIYVVSGPTSYLCDTSSQTITRYSGYTINSVQPINPSASPLNTSASSLLTQHVTGCSFVYQEGSSTRNGVITISLTITFNGEQVKLLQQVSVSNMP